MRKQPISGPGPGLKQPGVSITPPVFLAPAHCAQPLPPPPPPPPKIYYGPKRPPRPLAPPPLSLPPIRMDAPSSSSSPPITIDASHSSSSPPITPPGTSVSASVTPRSAARRMIPEIERGRSAAPPRGRSVTPHAQVVEPAIPVYTRHAVSVAPMPVIVRVPLYLCHINAVQTPYTAEMLARAFHSYFALQGGTHRMEWLLKFLPDKVHHYLNQPHVTHYTWEWLKFHRAGMHPSQWKWSIAQFLLSVGLTTAGAATIGGIFGGPAGAAKGAIFGAAIGCAIAGTILIGDAVCCQWNRAYENHIASQFDHDAVSRSIQSFMRTGQFDDAFKYLTAISYSTILRYAFWSSMMIRNKQIEFRASRGDIEKLFALIYAYKKATEHKFLRFFQDHFFPLFDVLEKRLVLHQKAIYAKFQDSVSKSPTEQYKLFTESVANFVVKEKIATTIFAPQIARDFVLEFLGEAPTPPPEEPAAEPSRRAEPARVAFGEHAARAPSRTTFTDHVALPESDKPSEDETLSPQEIEIRAAQTALRAGLEILERRAAHAAPKPLDAAAPKRTLGPILPPPRAPDVDRSTQVAALPVRHAVGAVGIEPCIEVAGALSYANPGLPFGVARGVICEPHVASAQLMSQLPSRSERLSAPVRPGLSVAARPLMHPPAHDRPLGVAGERLAALARETPVADPPVRRSEALDLSATPAPSGPSHAAPLLMRPMHYLMGRLGEDRFHEPYEEIKRVLPKRKPKPPVEDLLDPDTEAMYRALLRTHDDIRNRGEGITLIKVARRFGRKFLNNEEDVNPERIFGNPNQMLLFFNLDPVLRPTPLMFFTRIVMRVCSIFSKLKDYGRNREFKEILDIFDESCHLCVARPPAFVHPIPADAPRAGKLFLLFRQLDGRLVHFNELPDGPQKDFYIKKFSNSEKFPKIFQIMYRGLLDDMQTFSLRIHAQEQAFGIASFRNESVETLAAFYLDNCLSLFKIIGRLYYVRAFLEFFEEEARDTRQIFLRELPKIAQELVRMHDTPPRPQHESAEHLHQTDQILSELKKFMTHIAMRP